MIIAGFALGALAALTIIHAREQSLN